MKKEKINKMYVFASWNNDKKLLETLKRVQLRNILKIK